jgi:hypothetical protein
MQADLVRALVAGGPAPAGFDAAAVEAAARSLIGKRRREAARAWPAVSACLGEEYGAFFDAHARRTPPPLEGGPLADGRAFVRSIPWGRLDDAARLEVLHHDAAGSWFPLVYRMKRGVVFFIPWLGVWRMFA